MLNDTHIKNLFTSTYRYVVDSTLQRSYEWEDNRVINFINDIRKVKLTKNDGGQCRYNIGDFITYGNYDDSTDNVKYLCDGQQRMTTLVLLFANILHHGPSVKVKNSIKLILKKSSMNSDGYVKEVNVLTLKGTDDEILKKIIENGTLKKPSKEEKESHLTKVYNKITEKFTKDMNEEELSDFYTSIIKNASYFERECESKEEAIKQFNNLNGGQQSITDARKGIALLYGLYNEESCKEESYKEGSYKKDIENFLFELSNIPEKEAKEFLCLYLNYRDSKCRESDLPGGIKELDGKDDDLLNNMFDFYNQIYVENYKNRKVPFSDKTSLRQAWVDLYTDKYPSMKDIDISEKDKAYRKCEWGYICNRILNSSRGDKNLFYRMFNNFNPDCEQLSNYVVSYLRNKDLYGTVDIIDSYKREGKNGNDLYPKLLQRVEEQYQIDLDCKEAINHVSKPTWEHIRPRNPRNDEEYQCDDGFTNNFGNMTIIGGKANSSLSNKAFKDKIEGYKKSPYYINSHHLAKYDHWDGETVNDNKMFYFDELKKYYGL